MSIKVTYRGREVVIEEDKIKVKDLLREMGLSPLSAIVVREDEILSEEDLVKSGERIRIVNAISGGV